MEYVKTDEPMLQWHPAFFASIRIEFCEEETKMDFESEHQLGTKPMQIDVLIIKKNSNEPLEKNIGRIFRKHNFWLKNLTDDLSDTEAVRELAREYQNKQQNILYRSVMNVIIKANEELFKEESVVCEAIIDLFRDEYDKGIAEAKELGVQQGALQQLINLVNDGLLPLEVAVQRSGISKVDFIKMVENVGLS